jgi:uncharacterized protein (TIGR00730 family)
MLTSICIFCGSSAGKNPAFYQSAVRLGKLLARNSQTLVYGGSNVGLMKVIADAELSEGGRVVGVMVDYLVGKEVAHDALSELRIVPTMSQRKALMAELSDGFVALPGGIGTLDELFEIWTWSQLGFHRKPFGLLNVDGFFDPLIAYLKAVADQRFMRPDHLEMLLVEDDPVRLLGRMAAYQPSDSPKWVGGDVSE